MMLNLITWLRYCLSDFLHIMLSFPPLYTLCFLEGSHFVQPTLKRVRELCPTSLRADCINYLEFFVIGDLPILADLFVYSVTYLYQYELMNIYFQQINIWGKNPTLPIYFVARIVLTLDIGSSF